MALFRTMIDTVLPPRCPFTGDLVDRQGMVAAQAWAALNFIGSPVCDACGFPFEFSAGPGALCAGCSTQPPAFSRARSALVYDDASRGFILGFKHGDQTASVPAMMPWMKNAGADLWDGATLVVPVPLHPGRLLRRRYNQSALIGKEIARTVGLRFAADALIRSRATPTQGHLNATQRADNVRGAFAVNPRRAALLRDARVVLIDDVYTTGATVEECAKTLTRAGAQDVCVLTLARIVRPQRI